MAEAILMALSETLGRQRAHESVHHAAAAAATTGQTFAEMIAHEPAVTSRLTPGQMRALLDPSSHTGQRATIARQTAERTPVHIH